MSWGGLRGVMGMPQGCHGSVGALDVSCGCLRFVFLGLEV